MGTVEHFINGFLPPADDFLRKILNARALFLYESMAMLSGCVLYICTADD